MYMYGIYLHIHVHTERKGETVGKKGSRVGITSVPFYFPIIISTQLTAPCQASCSSAE